MAYYLDVTLGWVKSWWSAVPWLPSSLVCVEHPTPNTWILPYTRPCLVVDQTGRVTAQLNHEGAISILTKEGCETARQLCLTCQVQL